MFMGACFHCGQMGHKISDCPKNHNDANGTQDDDSQRKKPRVQGCVFAMTEQDAEPSNNIVTSTPSLFSKDARVLFDYGSTLFCIMCFCMSCR